MKNNIYLTYSKLSNHYGNALAYPTDKQCIYILKKNGFDFKEYEIVKVAEYNIETGVVTSIDPIRINDSICDDILN